MIVFLILWKVLTENQKELHTVIKIICNIYLLFVLKKNIQYWLIQLFSFYLTWERREEEKEKTKMPPKAKPKKLTRKELVSFTQFFLFILLLSLRNGCLISGSLSRRVAQKGWRRTQKTWGRRSDIEKDSRWATSQGRGAISCRREGSSERGRARTWKLEKLNH